MDAAETLFERLAAESELPSDATDLQRVDAERFEVLDIPCFPSWRMRDLVVVILRPSVAGFRL